jgi:hypothetical protein
MTIYEVSTEWLVSRCGIKDEVVLGLPRWQCSRVPNQLLNGDEIIGMAMANKRCQKQIMGWQ